MIFFHFQLYISCLLYLLGVLEANFMEPTHDKQDFERSALFVRMESRLKQMIIEYWFVSYMYIFCNNSCQSFVVSITLLMILCI